MAQQARFLTPASLRWVIRHRAWTPWYLARYWRFAMFRLRNPHVVTEGFVFLGRNVTLEARRGFGRLIIGRWVHIGSGNSIRCHEGRCASATSAFRQGQHRQRLPRHRVRRGHDRRRLGVRLRLRPRLRRRDDPDQGPGHREVAGTDRPGRLARHQGDRAARGDRRPGLRGRGERGGEQGPAAVLGGRRGAGPGGPGPAGRPTRRPRPGGRRWPTSPARPGWPPNVRSR
jgi:hypothetical protein